MRSDRHGGRGKHPHKDHPHHDDGGDATDTAPVEANPEMSAGKADASFSGAPIVPDAQVSEAAKAPMTPEANIADAAPEPPMVPTDTADESGGVVSAGSGGALHDAVVEIAGAADEEKAPE